MSKKKGAYFLFFTVLIGCLLSAPIVRALEDDSNWFTEDPEAQQPVTPFDTTALTTDAGPTFKVANGSLIAENRDGQSLVCVEGITDVGPIRVSKHGLIRTATTSSGDKVVFTTNGRYYVRPPDWIHNGDENIMLLKGGKILLTDTGELLSKPFSLVACQIGGQLQACQSMGGNQVGPNPDGKLLSTPLTYQVGWLPWDAQDGAQLHFVSEDGTPSGGKLQLPDPEGKEIIFLKEIKLLDVERVTGLIRSALLRTFSGEAILFDNSVLGQPRIVRNYQK